MMDYKEQVFTQLVREHKSTTYAVCYMFPKDSDEIDDLLQEILTRLWKGYDSFRAESDVRTWIYRVVLNCCLIADKKRRRSGEHVPMTVDINPFEDTDNRVLQTKRLLKACDDIIEQLKKKDEEYGRFYHQGN